MGEGLTRWGAVVRGVHRNTVSSPDKHECTNVGGGVVRKSLESEKGSNYELSVSRRTLKLCFLFYNFA